jgi:polysaccharide export outer membrane protein
VGPEDVLRITVYDHADLSQEIAVPPSGTFGYPLIGEVRAVGRTVQQLEKEMTQRLADGYIVNPRLTITVSQYRSRHVYVFGEVQVPGVYPLRYNATLLELLSQAKGLAPSAGWYALIVRGSQKLASTTRRPGAGSPDHATIRVDLEKLFAGELTQPIQIYSGDSIHVPKAGFVFVTGQVKNPGRYPLERNLTVDKAIILAGEFTRFAAKKRVRVRRIVQGNPREYRVHMHDVLQADDVVIVPESAF